MNTVLKKAAKNRTLVLASVFALLFNTSAPFFQTLGAATGEGYTTVVCTLFGEETVFVSLSEQDINKHHPSDCPKCPSCIALSNTSVWLPAFDFSVGTLVFRQGQIISELPVSAVNTAPFSHYLTRGPPV